MDKICSIILLYMLVNQVACCEQLNACMARKYMNQA